MAGNANSGRKSEALFYNALNVALKDHKDGPDFRLRRIANNLVKAAENNEQWAIREVADRLDGKPAQAIVGKEDDPLTLVHKIERVIVGPKPKD